MVLKTCLSDSQRRIVRQDSQENSKELLTHSFAEVREMVCVAGESIFRANDLEQCPQPS